MTVPTAGREDENFRLRPYQAEMVEESLKTNIIVVMDTGSGKTHIALARTAAELETCDSNKLVWFLSPTVALCHQQSQLFESNFPVFGVRDLAGRDDIEHWSDQRTWDSVFDNVRIVISTPQILLDALYHGFIQTKSLALIIFDEAHHCTGNHPANKILQEFCNPLYRSRYRSLEAPRILGLSASPVMKADASGSDLRKIEKNMNAVAKSPKLHRSDLLRFVHRPELFRIEYPLTTVPPPPLLEALKNEFNNYDLEKDPYVVSLLAEHRLGHDVTRKLEKVFQKHETYCSAQLKTLLAKTVDTFEELGPSAAEWYLRRCVAQFDTMWKIEQQLSGWSDGEKQHLSAILRRLPLPDGDWTPGDISRSLSPKVHTLINLLANEPHLDLTGLVFIEQRVWVAALLEILTTHPKTKDKFKFGTFVGSSQSSKRNANIANILEPRNQQETLDSFRAGDINVILATSVLEEGIDVSSCHLVICFERPKNLKSFIQRRGRARKQHSRYYIFTPLEPESTRALDKWESLEEEMKRAYLDDKRHIEAAQERESLREQSNRVYRIESTGALLTFENASQHLNHFCSTVTSKEYVDTRPQFTIEETPGIGISAKVTLPLSVDAAVRTAQSYEVWQTERMAVKDVCFQAYTALHQAGLVNDNLLPDKINAQDVALEFQIRDNTPSLMSVSTVLKPWLAAVAHGKRAPFVLHRTLLELRKPNQEPLFMQSLTPIEIPKMQRLALHWNRSTQYSVTYSSLGSAMFNESYIQLMRSVTNKIFQSVFHGRMQSNENDFVWLLIPSDASGALWDYTQLSTWHDNTNGDQPASGMIALGNFDTSNWGLMSVQGDMRKFLPRSIHPNPELDAGFSVEAIRLPRRRDFLHALRGQERESEAYSAVQDLVASETVVSNLPANYTIFALFAPSIIHTVELYMVADTLRTSLLAPAQFQPEHIPLILQALTASSVGEQSNYQRLEFLGDCILKYITSLHLMSQNLHSPESFLTGKKGKLVSNGFAARSALSIGLDKFILDKRFTGAKWAPQYLSDLAHDPEEKRILSSKILADVIESLIGASYITGGFPMALSCVRALLPSEPWTSLPVASAMLFDAAPSDLTITSLSNIETLISYTFTKKPLLLQALTHPDYQGPVESGTYERLEFLGDAVLDYIISRRLYAHAPELPHQKMHSIRAAMANASFLAFRMFETTLPIPSSTLSPSLSSFPGSSTSPLTRSLTLAQMLRFTSPLLSQARQAALTQHLQHRDHILHALTHDTRFPWHLFSLIDAPKFLSDIVESVLGAIFVDSRGDIAACEAYVETLGILPALRRVLGDGVDCLHPKERLGVLAGEKKVVYRRVGVGEGGGDGNAGGGGGSASASGNGGGVYRVKVSVGGVDVGGVVEGVKRVNAETMAAWAAVGILEDGGGSEIREEEVAMDVDGDLEMVEGDDEEGGGGVGIGEEEDDEEDEWFDAEEVKEVA
ncbi:P-loop containing nucleoside triphosphate hydrolase protein [Periconia macrospinosa]|uniref:P-loop containing nucleoside triphosphate hydrolase protein n=1 Tax=Periconia macrospinosa TaxID=97972 RepID=A0A2V1D892_9PLEO|nr:P-loop containing nucleoside triphosphate hydrolase protein [Periconia macrospinosa]